MALNIGSLTFDRPLFMAPMEGITDVPFRRIVRKHGCGVICTQMIHAEGLLRGDAQRMRDTTIMVPEEQPVGMQLCGPEPNIIAEAARKAEQMGAAFIDLNMGCPAKNVVALGAGAALMKTPSLAGAVVREVKRAVSIPVTVKIRAGWNDEYKTAPEVGAAVEKEGAALIVVHARTKAQKFKGKADWNLITELKSHLSIPVVGNGDIFHVGDAEAMQLETGADGVMVARGALGNPWIFESRRPTVGEIRSTLLEHLDLHLSFYKIQRTALLTFRKHIVWYTKGIANSSEFRTRVFKEYELEKILKMINDFFDTLDPNSYPDSHGE